MPTGKILIGGKECCVEKSERGTFIQGMPVDDFMRTLSFDDRLSLAMLGMKVKTKLVKTGSPQTTMLAIEQSKDVRN